MATADIRKRTLLIKNIDKPKLMTICLFDVLLSPLDSVKIRPGLTYCKHISKKCLWGHEKKYSAKLTAI